MRLRALLICAGLLCLADLGRAQPEGPPVRIKQVLVGFRSNTSQESPGRFKIGLWTPVAVDLEAGPRGLSNADLLVETPDSEDIETVYKVPIGALGKEERRTLITYTKPGNSEGRFKLSIRRDGRDVVTPITVSQMPMDLAGRMYLTVGRKLDALQDALVALRHKRPDLAENQDKGDTFPRVAGFETDPTRLPTLALGYDGVDLMILMTTDNNLVQGLLRDPARVKAIAQWVAQGGRLVVSVSWENQAEVSRLLQAPAWQPRITVALPAAPQDEPLANLKGVTEWAHVSVPFPLPGEDPVRVAHLNADKDHHPEWEVLADAGGQPLITRMPYGRGSITLLAFDLDKGPFSTWSGRKEFFKGLLTNLEPRIPQRAANEQPGFVANQAGAGQDLTTQLQIKLDQFDVPIIPFGWVALFIIVYILIVGPLDYFLLKRVFKRLEWTWITFPTVVLVVSAVSYFTAYAVKGRDLKVNKIDLVDFDLRTDLDENRQTRQAYAYGQTWFTIMSPRIQSYTIGIEPVVPGWLGKVNAPQSAEVVSWLGRPELDGPSAMGRQRAAGWSNRAYEYEPDAPGLKDVPIPVWTTKSFTASWASALPRVPVVADLKYYGKGNLKVAGKVRSFLPADLEDVWIFYGDHCFPLPSNLRRSTDEKAEQTIELLWDRKQDIEQWPTAIAPRAQATVKGLGDPTPLVKKLMFHARIDKGENQRNQAMHRLDLSWRVHQEPKTVNVREIILVGRLAPAAGNAEEVFRQHPMATLLWLGAVPGPGKERPALAGTIVQDTYVRIILPVRPGD